jgi:hypothetical protein
MPFERKRIANWTAGLAVGLLAVYLVSSGRGGSELSAQPNGQPVAKTTDADGPPARWEAATLKLDGLNRNLHIHRAAQLEAANRGVYFHRPLMAFAEWPGGQPGVPADYPRIVSNVEPTADGAILYFELQLSSPELRKACARTIVGDTENGDVAHAKANNLSLDSVQVHKFPLRRMVVDCLLHDEVLATGCTDSLISVGDSVKFFLPFSGTSLDRFKRSADCRFRISYSFSKVLADKFESEVTASKTVGDIIRSELTADQRNAEKGKPSRIFLGHKTRVERAVRASLQRDVRATSYKAFEAAQTGSQSPLAGIVFQSEGQQDLLKLANDEDYRRAVSDYLKPLIQSVTEKRTAAANKDITEGRTKTNKVTTKVGGSIGLAEGGKANAKVDADQTTELTDVEHNEVKEHSGVTFEQNKVNQVFEPVKIETFRQVEGSQSLKVSTKEVGYIVVGKNDDYLEDTPVPVSFTLDKLPKFPPADQAGRYYDGVPLGAMLPYFGAVPPKGYVFADGSSTWPNEPWVAEHLRGKPVPDMRAKMASGALSTGEVGQVWDQGRIKVGAAGFGLAANGSVPTGRTHKIDHLYGYVAQCYRKANGTNATLHYPGVSYHPEVHDFTGFPFGGNANNYRPPGRILTGAEAADVLPADRGVRGTDPNKEYFIINPLHAHIEQRQSDIEYYSLQYNLTGMHSVALNNRDTLPLSVVSHYIIRVE